jgi:hypothetical protein
MKNDDREIIDQLLAALPSLASAWVDQGDDPVVEAGEIGSYLVDLMELGGREQEIAAAFAIVEECLAELPPGDSGSAVLDTGLIESIQNRTLDESRPIRSSQFNPFLGPRTLDVWAALHRSWGTKDN